MKNAIATLAFAIGAVAASSAFADESLTVSRAEVRAELAQARAAGSFNTADTQYPAGFANVPAATLRTREKAPSEHRTFAERVHALKTKLAHPATGQSIGNNSDLYLHS
ncbi:hypothetical protein LMG27177_05714 [Paraburkholderia fynbosensis]|uniref:DUF4148 domain-containing protein n=2 Tax=Paraburkholderia fynbosensis TaxID=1200993 RepID=A0A6J5GQK8_9BURK|nr:hypothetical protein LMG27177_05714 [Paraburkholderia fynbosensis]